MFKFFYEHIHVFTFYILSLLMIFFSILTVSTNKTLRSAVFLSLVMTTNASLYLLLGSEFLAIVQMLVYVSGVVILLIFVIMLTDTLQDPKIYISFTRKFFSFFISIFFFIINSVSIVFLLPNKIELLTNLKMYNESNLAKIGFNFLDICQNGYIIPFELISLLLLVVLIGCLKISKE